MNKNKNKNKKQADVVWDKRSLVFTGVGINLVGIYLGFVLHKFTTPLNFQLPIL
jgi:hypothetical protein